MGRGRNDYLWTVNEMNLRSNGSFRFHGPELQLGLNYLGENLLDLPFSVGTVEFPLGKAIDVGLKGTQTRPQLIALRDGLQMFGVHCDLPFEKVTRIGHLSANLRVYLG